METTRPGGWEEVLGRPAPRLSYLSAIAPACVLRRWHPNCIG
jgi:hypothetical protein